MIIEDTEELLINFIENDSSASDQKKKGARYALNQLTAAALQYKRSSRELLNILQEWRVERESYSRKGTGNIHPIDSGA